MNIIVTPTLSSNAARHEGSKSMWVLFVVSIVTVCGCARDMQRASDAQLTLWLQKVPQDLLVVQLRTASPVPRPVFEIDKWTAEGSNFPMIKDDLLRMFDLQLSRRALEVSDHQDQSMDLCATLFALKFFGDNRCVQGLIECLNSNDPNERRLATIALGRIGDPRAIDAIGSRLDMIASGDFRVLIEALGELGGERSKKYLELAAVVGDESISQLARDKLDTITNNNQ
jgi:hypothetical protein